MNNLAPVEISCILHFSGVCEWRQMRCVSRQFRRVANQALSRKYHTFLDELVAYDATEEWVNPNVHATLTRLLVQWHAWCQRTSRVDDTAFTYNGAFRVIATAPESTRAVLEDKWLRDTSKERGQQHLKDGWDVMLNPYGMMVGRQPGESCARMIGLQSRPRSRMRTDYPSIRAPLKANEIPSHCWVCHTQRPIPPPPPVDPLDAFFGTLPFSQCLPVCFECERWFCANCERYHHMTSH